MSKRGNALRSPSNTRHSMSKPLFQGLEFPSRCYSIDVTVWKEDNYPLCAVSSFIPQLENSISFITGPDTEIFYKCQQSYPITKVQFCPAINKSTQLLASSGLDLHLWKLDTSRVIQHITLSNKKNLVSPPLTSFDWNQVDPALIGTCSIDTTCTIWNIETQQIKTQLIAHDKEVFDFAFSPSTPDKFISAGADGSMRLFDLRALEHSTILLEEFNGLPLMRVYWNMLDDNFVATFAQDSSTVCIVDLRQPGKCLASLKGPFAHSTDLTSLAWSPIQSNVLVSADEDGMMMMWDLVESVEKPVLFKQMKKSVSYLKWSPIYPHSLLVSNGNRLDTVSIE